MVGILTAVLIVGGIAAARVSLAGTTPDDGYNTTDALAAARALPNDQAMGPCPTASAPAKAGGKTGGQGGGKGTPTTAPSTAPTTAPTTAAPQHQHGGQPAASASASAAAGGMTCHQDQGGPVAADFVDIRTVKPNVQNPAKGKNASTGTFVSQCGKNDNGHHNPANYIVAPGVLDGAQHTHDYVGNLSTDQNSTDASLAAAGTTCRFNDQSPYVWPVLRRLGKVAPDANQPGGGLDGNVGTIIEPSSVTLQFRGNAQAKVTAMPRFLRIITGDAKAVTNGPANAKAAWTCTGFENRTTTKYPLCPSGSLVERVLDLPSCWDGTNLDSTNHRSHIVFPLSSGRCPKATKAVPQLRITLAYNVPPGRSFAVDTFPNQFHNPLTDHADFENVMPVNLMAFATQCINSGRRC